MTLWRQFAIKPEVTEWFYVTNVIHTHTHTTHQALLHGFLTRTLRECRVPHEEETLSPFKEGTGNDQGSFRMDVVTDQGALFSENRKYNKFLTDA